MAAGNRIAGGQGADRSRVVGGFCVRAQSVSYLRVGVGAEVSNARTKSITAERLAVYFPIADIDVDRDRIAELTLEELDHGIDRSLETCRRAGDARIPIDMDGQTCRGGGRGGISTATGRGGVVGGCPTSSTRIQWNEYQVALDLFCIV